MNICLLRDWENQLATNVFIFALYIILIPLITLEEDDSDDEAPPVAKKPKIDECASSTESSLSTDIERTDKVPPLFYLTKVRGIPPFSSSPVLSIGIQGSQTDRHFFMLLKMLVTDVKVCMIHNT